MPTTNRIIMTREDLRLLIECAERQEKVLRKKAEHQREMFDPFRPLPGGGRRKQRGLCITGNPF